MAFSSGTGTKLLINGRDLSAYFRRTTVPGTADTYDTTTYGKTSKVYIGGMLDGTISAEGLFDKAVLGPDDILKAGLAAATPVIWTVFPFGDVLGRTGRGVLGVEHRYEITAPVDGVVAVTAEVQNSSGTDPIKSLHALAQNPTGTTNGASIDNAALTSNGGVGYLQVTAEAASTATITIQHSVDNGTWVDLITFTAVTAAGSYERIAVAGTVNRYLRAVVVATGGTISSQVSFGRK